MKKVFIAGISGYSGCCAAVKMKEMGYELHMTKEDVCNLYLKISNESSEKPFEDAISSYQEVIKKCLSRYLCRELHFHELSYFQCLFL